MYFQDLFWTLQKLVLLLFLWGSASETSGLFFITQPNSTHTTHFNSSKHFTTLTSPTIFNQYQHNWTPPEPISTQLKSTQSKSNQPNIPQLNPTQLNLLNPTQLNISKLKSTQPNSTQPIPIHPNPKMPIQPKANLCWAELVLIRLIWANQYYSLI